MEQISLPSEVFGPNIVAVKYKRCYKYGASGVLKTNVRFRNTKTGRTYSIFQSSGKGRLWLRVQLNGKQWHVGRLVAWAFSNPRNLKWSTFAQRLAGRYKYEALHLSLDETNFSTENLQVGTRLQNLQQYRREASKKYAAVRRE